MTESANFQPDRLNFDDYIDWLEIENERLRRALERIADMPNGGVPGHAVAVGCHHNVVAWKALNAPDETECQKCDGRGFTIDWGPWKIERAEPREINYHGQSQMIQDEHITNERAEKGKGVLHGKRIPCECGDGWIHV